MTCDVQAAQQNLNLSVNSLIDPRRQKAKREEGSNERWSTRIRNLDSDRGSRLLKSSQFLELVTVRDTNAVSICPSNSAGGHTSRHQR